MQLLCEKTVPCCSSSSIDDGLKRVKRVEHSLTKLYVDMPDDRSAPDLLRNIENPLITMG